MMSEESIADNITGANIAFGNMAGNKYIFSAFCSLLSFGFCGRIAPSSKINNEL